eukprot:TRINITY_DN111943_c0_g1_i1.p1 TRINITY_DN111943_c0_g1~~TRINITY_DN111943_c0_g1_i1.p1  ORF type:complete len:513 (+),score=111.31 TRINITY_DN111943_c0_g1_i1:121-1659(+)
MDVSFTVRCGDTKPGQHLRVVGSCASLGDWTPAKGLVLYTSATEFPSWLSADLASASNGASKAKIQLSKADKIEYKYVICGSDGQPQRWEERPNRVLQLGSVASAHAVLMETFNGSAESDASRFHFPAGLTTSGGYGGARSSHDLIAPTVRDRRNSSKKCSLASASSGNSLRQRSASRSYFLLPEEVPEEAPKPDEPVPQESLKVLMREESCSMMMADEDLPFDRQSSMAEFYDRYDVLGDSPLGEGTFGLVWRCLPKETVGQAAENGAVRHRAAKVVRKARLQPHDMQYLIGPDGEVQTHLKMKHEHIVALYEFFNEAQTVTLVVEYCPGGDLFDAVVGQKGFKETAAVVASRHLLLALAYMHERSVVHRDIKCENILLSLTKVPYEENVYKLCDFGFATYIRGDGLVDRLGSPDTVAPEVVSGSTYGVAVDVWSAGVLLYMMISATPPFFAATDAEVLRKVRTGSYCLSGGVWEAASKSLKNAIAALMTVDCKRRPTALEALDLPWFSSE